MMSANKDSEIHNIVKAPVFIVGEARSGSSILHRTLELHSSFRPRRVLHLESKILWFTGRSFMLEERKPGPCMGPYMYYLKDEAVIKKFIDSIRSVQRLHRFLYSISPRITVLMNRSTLLWSLLGNKRMLHSFFRYSLEARGSNRVVEKTPDNAVNSEKLLHAFPDCKIIYIYRHPVDVFSSYRKLAAEMGAGSWADISIEKFCKMYDLRADYMLRFKKRHYSNCFLISYEEFIENPKAQMARICDFVGVPYDEGCFDTSKSDRMKKVNDIANKALAGAVGDVKKVWAEHIDEAAAVDVETRLTSIMKRLGYTRYT